MHGTHTLHSCKLQYRTTHTDPLADGTQLIPPPPQTPRPHGATALHTDPNTPARLPAHTALGRPAGRGTFSGQWRRSQYGFGLSPALKDPRISIRAAQDSAHHLQGTNF